MLISKSIHSRKDFGRVKGKNRKFHDRSERSERRCSIYIYMYSKILITRTLWGWDEPAPHDQHHCRVKLKTETDTNTRTDGPTHAGRPTTDRSAHRSDHDHDHDHSIEIPPTSGEGGLGLPLSKQMILRDAHARLPGASPGADLDPAQSRVQGGYRLLRNSKTLTCTNFHALWAIVGAAIRKLSPPEGLRNTDEYSLSCSWGLLDHSLSPQTPEQAPRMPPRTTIWSSRTPP